MIYTINGCIIRSQRIVNRSINVSLRRNSGLVTRGLNYDNKARESRLALSCGRAWFRAALEYVERTIYLCRDSTLERVITVKQNFCRSYHSAGEIGSAIHVRQMRWTLSSVRKLPFSSFPISPNLLTFMEIPGDAGSFNSFFFRSTFNPQLIPSDCKLLSLKTLFNFFLFK